MKPSLISLNPKILGFIAILLIAVPLTLYLVKQQQDTRQQAWYSTQSALTSCDKNGKIVVNVRFTNTESKTSAKSINVEALDMQSANGVNLGTIKPGETKSTGIQTNQTSVTDGSVKFTLSRSDGVSGSKTQSAAYKALASCKVQSENLLMPGDIIASPSGLTITPVMSITTPVISPTIVLPAKSGVGGCIVPKKVENIKIICKFCQG